MIKKTAIFSILALSAGLVATANAAIYNYDFGTGTGTFTSTTASTSFLPTAPSGTSRVRAGGNGASIDLVTPGSPDLGPGSQLRITAATGGTITKFSIYDFASPSTTYSMQFTMSLAGTSGEFFMIAGDGATFSDNNGFSSAQTFTGLHFILGAGSTLTTEYRNAGNWSTSGLTTTGITKGSALTFTLYGNNAASGSQNYTYLGNTYSLAAGTQDIWLGATLIGNDLAKSSLPSGNVDSFMFYGLSSAGNVGVMNIDTIQYANSLAIIPEPHEYAFAVVGMLGVFIVMRRRRAARTGA